ncbi:MAG: hypothetical protein AAF405_00020 [Pseudomonadota bacterium]
MRLILLLIVIIAIAALIQTKRHDCKWGSDDWFSCVVDNTKKEYYSLNGQGLPVSYAGKAAARASAI